MVRKVQDEASATADGNNSADAGGVGVAAEVAERLKRKTKTTAAAVGRKKKRNRPSLVHESRELAEESGMVKDVSRLKRQQEQSQEMNGGDDLLDTSEEMVDEEFESVEEGHGTNRDLEERNEMVLKDKATVREEQRGEGEAGNTFEESEEDSRLLTISYQGEVAEVNI